MSKKKVELTKFSGWSEERMNKVIQRLNPDGTEDLERRVEQMKRLYFGYWSRIEDEERIITAEISPTIAFGKTGSFRVEVFAMAFGGRIDMTSVAPAIDSAKSMAEHRAQKWIEQYAEFLLPTIN